jgi:membrane protein DedA with SNARE-associated domain
MLHILRQYGYSIIFLSVFVENLGLPVPSYPLILFASALVADLHLHLGGILAVSMLGALAGDAIWYLLGRLRGRPILRKVCSLSLYPDSCVSRTEGFFERHGLKSLLVAKFLPGLNTVAPPLAGMLQISPLRFGLVDLAGIGLWTGSAVALGWGFRTQVEWLLDWLAAFGRAGILILLSALAGYILVKWLQRVRFQRLLAKSRIAPAEVKDRLERGEEIVIVDLRSGLGYEADGVKIAGAIHIPPGEFPARYSEIPAGKPVVMYCT